MFELYVRISQRNAIDLSFTFILLKEWVDDLRNMIVSLKEYAQCLMKTFIFLKEKDIL